MHNVLLFACVDIFFLSFALATCVPMEYFHDRYKITYADCCTTNL